MRLSCPNCLTEYEIPDAALAGRTRALRCAHCGHQWRHLGAAADDVTAAPEPVPAPEFEAAAVAEPVLDDPSPARTPWPSYEEPEAAPWPEVPAPADYTAVDWPAPDPVPVPEPAAARMIWPEPEPAPVTVRSFGFAVDDAAKAEFAAAADREAAAQAVPAAEPVPEMLPEPVVEPDELESTPARLRAVPDAVFEAEAETDTDSFTALMNKARRNSLQFEPEPPPAPARKPNKAAIFILIVLIVACLVLVAHRAIMKAVPASAGFFHALGLH